MTIEEVKKLMLSSKSVDEWNKNTDYVKTQFGNNYPGFWYSEIILKGVHIQSQANNNWNY